jgi:four helix bundle protein
MLLEELKRAALSIPLNIAEGAGKQGTLERKRYYGIARGSAMECGAILDACRVLRLADEQALEARKTLLVRIVSMLTKLCK